MAGTVRLDVDGAIATITNDNPDKHNAFDDDMDVQLFEILDELVGRNDIRAMIWRGEGKSFSSGRDVGSIGNLKVPLSHHELMRRGHRGIQRLWDVDAPVIVACKGWVMGGSFQRALLCDVRVAAEGTRFRLPETTYGVIPDTGGVAVLYEMCGPRHRERHGADGTRPLGRGGARARHRVAASSPKTSSTRRCARWPSRSRSAPAVTIKMAREVIRHLAQPQIRTSMNDEMIYQTFINRSDDMAEMRAARDAEDRPPHYTGS